MGSMETTVIATAMPTIVGELGGLSIYGWTFSIYVLASSAGIPVAGKLSDILGRKLVYLWCMGLFLMASVFCAFAPTMVWLIALRGLQGLGAAGLLPLALVMVGDLFTFEERARIQGLFSAVWGISSVAGPLIGGALVDRFGWPSVFYVNVPFGLLSAGLVWRWWQDRPQVPGERPHIDYGGAALITLAAIALMLGLLDLSSWTGLGLIGLSVLLTGWLWQVEKKSPDPVLPLRLLDWSLFRMAVLHSLVIGWILSGITAYVPLFVQQVQGKSATVAGASLTPLLLAWVVANVFCARLMLRFGYRTPALFGMLSAISGAGLLALIQQDSSPVLLMGSMVMLGIGFGMAVPAFLIAVQMTVERKSMGMATSSLQFARNLGGAIGVGVMGAFLNWRVPAAGLAEGLRVTFWVAGVVTVLGLLFTFLAPKVSAEEMGRRR